MEVNTLSHSHYSFDLVSLSLSKPELLFLLLLFPNNLQVPVFPRALSQFDGSAAYVFTCKHTKTSQIFIQWLETAQNE